jgi:hypothetical protein
MEVVDAGMLKKPSDNRTYGNILADTGDTRAQATDAPDL